MIHNDVIARVHTFLNAPKSATRTTATYDRAAVAGLMREILQIAESNGATIIRGEPRATIDTGKGTT